MANFSAARAASASISRINPERIRQPLVRRNGKLEPASWEDALEEVARRLKQVHEKHGAAAIGVIGSNHTTNEENYLLNRFARVTLGTNNHRPPSHRGLCRPCRRAGPASEGFARHDGGYLQCARRPADRQRRHPAESACRLADSHRRSPSRLAPLRASTAAPARFIARPTNRHRAASVEQSAKLFSGLQPKKANSIRRSRNRWSS